MTNASDHTLKTVIFCTHTVRAIDILNSDEDADARIAALACDYGSSLTLLTAEDALNRAEAPFISDCEEITDARFYEMFNVLPPAGWKTDSDGESFKMCEYTSGRITAIFVRIGARYVTFSDRMATPHRECCRRGAAYVAAHPF